MHYGAFSVIGVEPIDIAGLRSYWAMVDIGIDIKARFLNCHVRLHAILIANSIIYFPFLNVSKINITVGI